MRLRAILFYCEPAFFWYPVLVRTSESIHPACNESLIAGDGYDERGHHDEKTTFN
jgi:hypothetical protein